MTRKLSAADESLHPMPNEGTNQENYLFGGLDAKQRAGFYLHVGRQHGLGVCITKVVVFDAAGMYSTAVSRPLTESLDFPMGEMTAVEPFRSWRLRLAGTLGPAVAGYHCVGEGSGVAYELDVELRTGHDPVVTDYAADGRDPAVTSGMHYEQGMRMVGQLVIDGRVTPLRGQLIRDHTWGTRALRRVDTVWWTPVAITDPAPRFLRVTDVIQDGQHQSLAVDLDADSTETVYRTVEVAPDDEATDGPLCGSIIVGTAEHAIKVRFDGVARLPMTYLEGWGDRPMLSDETFAVASFPDGTAGMAIVEWNRPMPADAVARLRAAKTSLGTTGDAVSAGGDCAG